MEILNQITPGPVQNISPVSSQTLVSGNSVFVRVIAANPDGSYLVSAGGNRLNVQSQNPLQSGETFVATLKSGESGQILMEPVAENRASYSDSLQSFLSSQSIPENDPSFKILQFMEQSGMKIDLGLMEKAKNIGKRFKGKERLASEAAAVLLEKGVTPTEENILALMSLSVGEYGGEKNQRNPNENPEKDEKNFLHRIFPHGTNGSEGFLTFINHVGLGKRHWIFLPFEVDLDGEVGRGTIRILLDTESKKTEKILLNCDFNSTKFYFVLYCSGGNGKEVRFFTLPPLLASQVKVEELRLGGFLSSGMGDFGPVDVTYSDSALSDGLFTVEELPSTVEIQA